MNPSDVAVFNNVAATLSFTATARRLGLSRSAVSKRIARLEADTGAVLFRRSPRSISLTAAGEQFYSWTMKLDETLRLARQAVRDVNDVPSGRLSLTVPTALATSMLPLLMRDFREQWPQIDLNINMDDLYLDIVGDGYDIAVRIAKRLGDSSLIARRLMSTPDVLLASPGYIKKCGRPQHIQDLRDHHCLAFVKRYSAWRFSTVEGHARVDLKNVTTFSNQYTMVLAACLDSGIIRVPRLVAESEIKLGLLVPILQKCSSQKPFGVFAVYPDRRLPANVRAFLEFIEQWLPRIGDLARWNPSLGNMANRIPYSQGPFALERANGEASPAGVR